MQTCEFEKDILTFTNEQKQESGLYPLQKMMIEIKNEDGTWPREDKEWVLCFIYLLSYADLTFDCLMFLHIVWSLLVILPKSPYSKYLI